MSLRHTLSPNRYSKGLVLIGLTLYETGSRITYLNRGAHCNYSFLEGSFKNHLVIFVVDGPSEAPPHDLPLAKRTSKQFGHEGFLNKLYYISNVILPYRGVSIEL